VEDYNAVFLPWGKRWNGSNVASQLVDKCVAASPRKLRLFYHARCSRARSRSSRERGERGRGAPAPPKWGRRNGATMACIRDVIRLAAERSKKRIEHNIT
jgi:hypothetical protein